MCTYDVALLKYAILNLIVRLISTLCRVTGKFANPLQFNIHNQTVPNLNQPSQPLGWMEWPLPPSVWFWPDVAPTDKVNTVGWFPLRTGNQAGPSPIETTAGQVTQIRNVEPRRLHSGRLVVYNRQSTRFIRWRSDRNWIYLCRRAVP